MIVKRVWPARPTFEMGESALDHLRREMLRTLDTLAEPRAHAGPSGVYPPVNVTQDDERFYVRAELPGVAARELSITALRNRLSISGKREIKKEHDRVSYHRRERADGPFNRTLTLPAPIDADRIEARYAGGVLTVILPKAEEAKPRQIVVKT